MHGLQRSCCDECGSVCQHKKWRSQCKECGGSNVCEHGRQRSNCKECGGSSICEHGGRRYSCKECGGGGPVTFVEATEVELVFDGEEEPDEGPAIVRAHVVTETRGGKRKR